MGDSQERLNATLRELSIESVVIQHPEVFTVEAMLPYLTECKGLVTKNLFLKGKKKKDLWLISVGHDKEVNLSGLGKELSIPGGFRFADETILEEKLGVKQGCVTPLAVLNDTECKVTLVLDNDVLNLPDGELVYSHPMVNTATVGMSSEDLLRFLEYTKHTPKFVEMVKKSDS